MTNQPERTLTREYLLSLLSSEAKRLLTPAEYAQYEAAKWDEYCRDRDCGS